MAEAERRDTIINVGIAEAALVRAPRRIRTTGLGSCVGLVIYDLDARLAGLAHVMLPATPQDHDGVAGRRDPHLASPSPKYADGAVEWLLTELRQEGARRSALRAKFAGGAQMFSTHGLSEFMRIGPRNVEAVQTALASHRIPVLAVDVGGNVGRTIEFDCETGGLSIRTAMQGTKVL